MSAYVAFLPRNNALLDMFRQAGKVLREKYNCEVLYIRELGNIRGEEVFEFGRAIEEKWNDIDVSYASLCNLEEKYPESNLLRALYCERQYNFLPGYLNYRRIPYQKQLKYLVGCFAVFEQWLAEKQVDCIVSELLTGLPDSVLCSVCKKKGVPYISLRSSKLLPGIITCDQEFDLPAGMLGVYKDFRLHGIPDEYYDLAKSHIDELRSKILMPSYMEVSGRRFRLLNWQSVRNLVSRLGKNKTPTSGISLLQHPIRNSALLIIYRFLNIRRTKRNESEWFCKELPSGEKYFVYPLQYEPEASTLIRAFPFSDQMCVIQQVAKALPLGVTLAVKEHRGNQGYRKPAFYRDLHYLPNVKLMPREADVRALIKNSMGVITLTSRMGWEALVLRKPVITFGSSFWTGFEEVRKPGSWTELKAIVEHCVDDEGHVGSDYDEKLLAYAAAYISLIHKGNFVLGSKQFLIPKNIENVARIVLSTLQREQVGG
jgi:hypothetical protein